MQPIQSFLPDVPRRTPGLKKKTEMLVGKLQNKTSNGGYGFI